MQNSITAPAALAVMLALAACAQFPELDNGPDAALPPGTVAPVLVPLGPMLARAEQITVGPETTADLLARAAALRARAARLRARKVGA